MGLAWRESGAGPPAAEPAAEGEEEESSAVAARQPPEEEQPQRVEVEQDHGDDMIDAVFRSLPRRLGGQATRLMELLLTTGLSPGDAKLKVSELFSPPRLTRELGRLPRMTLAPLSGGIGK